jgi:hypothetical protein
MRIRKYSGLMMCLAMSACGTSVDNISGAADISPSLLSPEAQNAAQSTGQKRQYLGLVAGDSEDKCKQFALALIGSETNFNTGSDIAVTITQALGTAFTPLTTVHAFTAAGAIISGSKTAVNADVWAKQPITNLLAAIGNKYYVPMATYTAALEKASEDSLVVSIEVDNIKAIHQACNLASAQTAIQSKVAEPTGSTQQQQGPPPPAPPGVVGGAAPTPEAPDLGLAPAPVVGGRPVPSPRNPYGAW